MPTHQDFPDPDFGRRRTGGRLRRRSPWNLGITLMLLTAVGYGAADLASHTSTHSAVQKPTGVIDPTQPRSSDIGAVTTPSQPPIISAPTTQPRILAPVAEQFSFART